MGVRKYILCTYVPPCTISMVLCYVATVRCKKKLTCRDCNNAVAA